jgi:hypothetical protein
MGRFLLVLVLFLFAIYPIVDSALDAYSDHLTHPEWMSPDHRINAPKHDHRYVQTAGVVQCILAAEIDNTAFLFFRNAAVPSSIMISFQSCSPLSSDLPPPLV